MKKALRYHCHSNSQHNCAGVVQEGRAADVVEASARSDKGATVDGGDNNAPPPSAPLPPPPLSPPTSAPSPPVAAASVAPVESLVVATIEDTLAGGEVFVGDVAAATGGDGKELGEHFVVATVGDAAAVGDTNAGADLVVGKCTPISEFLCVVDAKQIYSVHLGSTRLCRVVSLSWCARGHRCFVFNPAPFPANNI